MDGDPAADAGCDPFILSVSKDGFVALGERLRTEMLKRDGALCFEFRLEPGSQTLALIPQQNGTYQFPKGGRIKDEETSKRLIQDGISLPARYHVAYNEGVQAWVGCLAGAPCGSREAALRKALSKPSRRKADTHHE